MSKFCQKCGRPMADDMRFCEACGAPAPVAAPQQPAYQQPAPQQPVYQQPVYQQPAPQQPVYQQPAPQQPVYRQPAPQQPVYQQPAPQQPVYQQPAPQAGYRTAPVAAPAKPQSSFDLNKVFDQVKTFANGVVNRCKTDKKFLITCCGIAAAVVLVIILAIVLLGKPAYQKPIDTYISVMFKGKASKIKSLAPDAYWEYMEDEEDLDVDEFIEDYEDEWDDFIDEMEDEYGDNIRVTYKVEKVKDLSDKKVEKIAEALDEQYDIDEKSVKAAKRLDLEMTIKGSEDDDDNDAEFTVVKIGSKWYMINYYESGDEYRVYFLGSLN